MELASRDLAALGAADLVRVSATIPRAAPRTFALLTACLVFPLSFAVFAHSIFTHPILLRLQNTNSDYSDSAQWLKLFAYQFLYLIFLFTFSLLSTAAVVFTVASLYAAKPASIGSSLAALLPILPRLLRTFLWVSLLMLVYHLVFALTVLLLLVFSPSSSPSSPPSLSFVLLLVVVVFAFLAIHVYISGLWHLASVISVLEPLCGLAAMAKSKQLLQGRTRTAARPKHYPVPNSYRRRAAAMRLLSGASASRLPSPLLSFARARPRCVPASASACRAAFSSPAGAGDGGAQKPWLFVGLGNPGKVYQGTRHNVGFEMIDVIAEAEGISISSMQFKAMVGKGRIGDFPIMLAKPQTFMNASGESVGQLISYFKIPINQVLVMYDDLDLPFAKLRLLPKGGHGGHNGMRSIINHLKQQRDFPRLRIGIGRPPGKMDPASFVLRPFNKKEQEELDFTFHRGLEAVRIMVLEGFNKSATYVNTVQSSEMLNR